MEYTLNSIPLFQHLEESKNVLLAGAGGGFDIYSGLPLYFNLINQGKNVVIANFSFTWLDETTSEKVFPFCYKIRGGDSDRSGRNYFPEKYLKLWLGMQGKNPTVYGFNRTGIQPLKAAYKYIQKEHDIDTLILIDGGTDSLMFGDEEGLGTPQEDMCSMIAAYKSGIKNQFLVSVGFGIDHFHGVSHYRFLENVAELSRDGGYLGTFQLLNEMPESKKYIDAVNFANGHMMRKESIVSNSITSALEGHYGNYHKTSRTKGSELWINPLMTIYWNFQLRNVVRKIKYYDYVEKTNTIGEFNKGLSDYLSTLSEIRSKKQIPI